MRRRVRRVQPDGHLVFGKGAAVFAPCKLDTRLQRVKNGVLVVGLERLVGGGQCLVEDFLGRLGIPVHHAEDHGIGPPGVRFAEIRIEFAAAEQQLLSLEVVLCRKAEEMINAQVIAVPGPEVALLASRHFPALRKRRSPAPAARRSSR